MSSAPSHSLWPDLRSFGRTDMIPHPQTTTAWTVHRVHSDPETRRISRIGAARQAESDASCASRQPQWTADWDGNPDVTTTPEST